MPELPTLEAPPTSRPFKDPGHLSPHERVLAEHAELRQTIRELREFAGKPRPGVAEEGCHGWGECLAHRLLELHEKLSAHFREEECSGILEELAITFPRASSEVQTLEEEHREMLRELRAVIPEALRFAEARPQTGAGLRRRTLTLLDRLTEHEARETDLIERLYCEDVGTGD